MKEETQTNAQAILIFQELQKFPWFRFFHEEPEGLEKTWWKLAGVRQNAPKLWMDSYLAAFAITEGVQLVTFDRGFHRYIKNDLDLLLLNEPSL